MDSSLFYYNSYDNLSTKEILMPSRKANPSRVAMDCIEIMIEAKLEELRVNPYHHKSQEFLDYESSRNEDIERLNEALDILKEIQ